MKSPTQQRDEHPNESEQGDDVWVAQAWVYAIWVVMGNRLFCKIGYSTTLPRV